MVVKVFLLEAWAVLRVLSLGRIRNAFQLITSYLFAYYGKTIKIKGNPMAFAVEPTSICNLACPECPTGANLLKRPRGMMPLKDYTSILQQLAPELLYLNLYIQGEPLMHPEFGTMVKKAAQLKLYTSTSTNGHFMGKQLARQLVEGGLTRLIFSVDGTSQESYGLYRVGGSFNRVKQSIIDVVRAKQEAQSLYPIIVMQFIVFRHNEHELPYVKKLARKLKVDKLEIKTAQFYNFGTMRPPLNARFSRYKDELGRLLKTQTKNRCWRQWHSATVTWDGRFAPCCYDKDAIHAFGNVHSRPIKELWRGNNSQNFKQQIFLNRSAIDMCNNCPEGKHLF
ncbi:radical SAM/SPASM domain-containing protein [Carboxylicivirga taeanensis]|uniref:radical SAM/SPASM domain-containing protein n=1 Tax=Carboxylicivirga taeanensis TaxID=1416875 RepID=UPI003F6E2853